MLLFGSRHWVILTNWKLHVVSLKFSIQSFFVSSLATYFTSFSKVNFVLGLERHIRILLITMPRYWRLISTFVLLLHVQACSQIVFSFLKTLWWRLSVIRNQNILLSLSYIWKNHIFVILSNISWQIHSMYFYSISIDQE